MKTTQFEWQADEDEDLGETASQVRGRPARWRQRFGPWFLLILVALFVLAYWTLNRRQSSIEEEVKQDVASSFELWQAAIAHADLELFVLLLSRDDMVWRNKQKQLFGEGLILDRANLGFHVQMGSASAPTVTLAPEMNRALVSFEQEYTIGAEPYDGNVVRLSHNVMYDLQDSRWLQSPFDEEFWGERQTNRGELLMLQYPQRDAELAQRIGRQLETDLQAICAARDDGQMTESYVCSGDRQLFLKMNTDLSSLDALAQASGPFYDGRGYHLPAPTLIGYPLDEDSYQAFYKGYTRGIIEEFRSLTGAPIPLPDKSIRTLCFNFPSGGLRLFRYDIALDTWMAELPDHAFYYMTALPNDNGVILQVATPDIIDDRLHILQWQADHESLLLDEDLALLPFRPIGWAAPDDQARLLLQGRSENWTSTTDAWLDLHSCDDAGCDLQALPGFTAWAPDGRHTLIAVNSDIVLGDETAQSRRSFGNGFNPFWLDDSTFAFIRFTTDETGRTGQVVIGNTNEDKVRVLFDGNDLGRAAGIEENGELFINYVEVSPTDPNLLLISASGVRNQSGHYFVFSYQLPDGKDQEAAGQIILRLRREGAPWGTPVLLTPTGFPPFIVSPDGRWLVLSELKSDDNSTWTIHLHDLERNQTKTLPYSFPVVPARFPFLDWSADGHWLVIADDGFFRLIAPEQDYERLVPHDYDRCFYTVWNE